MYARERDRPDAKQARAAWFTQFMETPVDRLDFL